MKYFIFLALCLSSCISCKAPLVDYGLDFTIKNKKTDTITWFVPSVDEQLSSVGLPKERPKIVSRIIPPNAVHGEWLQAHEGKNFFDELPTDTLYFFVLKYNDYSTKPWDTIVANDLFLERVKVTEDSLKSLNYLIVID